MTGDALAGLHFVVPGPLDQRTGGYLYDARMVAGLRSTGRTVEVHELPGRFPDPDPTARAALEGALASAPDDAPVVLDGLAAGLLPDVVAEAAGRLRVVALVHHPLAEETGLTRSQRQRYAALERRTLAACRGIVVTSSFTAERLGAWGVPGDRIRTVVPGTEPAPEARGPGPEAPPLLLSVGSVTPRKGHDVLVAALRRLGDLSWRCVCAGSLDRAPAFATSVREAAASAGLSDRIRFTGELDREALDRLYHRSSLLVLASHYEGYGMALTEALARGLPVVSTTGGAIPHTVPAGAGVLVPPGDPAALAHALRRLLEDPAARAELAREARAHARMLPDWTQAQAAFAEAVGTLAAHPAPRGAG